jgi:hypothetical protein
VQAVEKGGVWWSVWHRTNGVSYPGETEEARMWGGASGTVWEVVGRFLGPG